MPKVDDGTYYLPFFISIKKTKMEDNKLEELRKKLADTVTYQEALNAKAEMIPLSMIQDRIKKE